MPNRVYLDNSATTPVDPRVIEVLMPFITQKFGNASSVHQFGQEVRGEIDRARHLAAELISARQDQLTFTSGGTEANNLAIRGFCEANSGHGKHIITSAIEHPSVLNVCERMKDHGYSLTVLPVNEFGIVDSEDVRAALRDDTLLVSIMAANNEIGTIQPIREIGEIIKEQRNKGSKVRFHTDAVQAVGKINVDVGQLGCDMLTFSGHKIYAPKGVGVLYTGRGVRIQSQNLGGHQERERRGGTENVALIVALGKACEIAKSELVQNASKIKEIRDEFERRIKDEIPDILMNGDPVVRIPNISNISFKGIDGEALLINLDLQGIAVSTGSACSSGSLEPSPIILALGCDTVEARGAVRFSFGKENSMEELDFVVETTTKAVNNVRRLSKHIA